MDETTTTVALMDKRADELTVKDNLKLVAIGAAMFVAIPVAFNALAVGVTKLSEVRQARKARKAQEKTDEEK